MIEGMTTALGGAPLVDTRDVDAAREAIGRIFCPHFLSVGPGGGARFHARHSVAEEPGYSVNLVSYGAEVEIDPGELSDFFLLQLPLKGQAVVRHGNETVQASAGRAASLLSPTLATRMTWAQDCRKLILLLRRDSVERHFETLTHGKAGAIEFRPAIALDTAVGQGIDTHLRLILSSVGAGLPQAYRTLLGEGLINLLLTGLVHNRMGALTAPSAPDGPACVRRADDFIHAHADRPIAAADIAAAAGVPLRTLQHSWRLARGCTLIEALQAVRLERLRIMLTTPTPCLSVADAVFACGLGHLGRAAAAYRQRYGESPSQTLRDNAR